MQNIKSPVPDATVPGMVAETVSLSNPAILTIAHRGDWTHAPENSLAAIRAAIAGGVEIVEFDTQPTSDGELIVMHDETYDRTSTLSGPIEALPLSVVRSARLRQSDGIDQPLTDERIPTLAEGLEEARGRIIVNIDTKYDKDLAQVTRTVLDLGVADQVIIKSTIASREDFDAVNAMPFYGRIPYMPRFDLHRATINERLNYTRMLVSQIIEIKFFDWADLRAVRALCEPAGIRIWANTLDVSYSLDLNDTQALVDPDAIWGRLIAEGVGAIQTDQIEPFRNWLRKKGRLNRPGFVGGPNSGEDGR